MVFLFRLMIRKDLVMIHMPHSVQVTLWNWRTGAVLLLNFINSEVCRTINFVNFSFLMKVH